MALLWHTPRACSIQLMKCTTCYLTVKTKSDMFVSRIYGEIADTLLTSLPQNEIDSTKPQNTRKNTRLVCHIYSQLNHTFHTRYPCFSSLYQIATLTTCLESKLFPVERSPVLHVAWVFFRIRLLGLAGLAGLARLAGLDGLDCCARLGKHP